MNSVENFVNDIAAFRSENVFNPYADFCPEHDRSDAPTIRRRNLRLAIEASLSIGVESIWFGRDLGYRGGRRTGLALTDEPHLPALGAGLGNVVFTRATVTAPVAERTANEIWKMIRCLPKQPFLWNAFPFHPYEPDEPMTNRCHTAHEVRRCEWIVETLVDWFRPDRIIALGKDAHRALRRLGYDSTCIRHPSYGGQAEFIAGVRQAYGLPSKQQQPPAS
jgi:hypothetical protein